MNYSKMSIEELAALKRDNAREQARLSEENRKIDDVLTPMRHARWEEAQERLRQTQAEESAASNVRGAPASAKGGG